MSSEITPLPPVPSSFSPTLPISAVDAISPATQTTKQLMFRPMRWSRWWRTALIALATGEISSVGSCNFSGLDQLIPNSRPANGSQDFAGVHLFPWGADPTTIALLVTTLIAGVLLLLLVHLYIASVFRFVLFDAVVNGRFRLLEGWRRWHSEGRRFFFFQITFLLLSFLGLGILIGIPAAIAFAGGFFHDPSHHMGRIFVAVTLLLPILIVYLVIVSLIGLFAKDFSIPVMAIEGIPFLPAFRRVGESVLQSKAAYAGYVGMKIVLALAIGIAVGIIGVVISFIIIVPLGLTIYASGVFSHLPPATNIFSWVLLGTAIVMAILLMIFLMVLISSPATIFFQAYVLEFFAARYLPLAALLHPPAPPAEPLASAIS